MSNKPFSFVDAQGALEDQRPIDFLKMQKRVAQQQLDEQLAVEAEILDAEAAAKEAITDTVKILAGPPQLDITRAARNEKADAEEILKICAEKLPVIQKNISVIRQRLAQLEKQEQEFSYDRINAGRQLELRRHRMNRVRST